MVKNDKPLLLIGTGLGIFIVVIGCEPRFQANDYLAIHINAAWNFDGPIRSLEVVDSIPDRYSEQKTTYLLRILDRKGTPIQAVLLQRGRQITLNELNLTGQSNQMIRFVPPLPISVLTNHVGDIVTLETTEFRDNRLEPAAHARIQIIILSPMKITIGDTVLTDILRLQVQYSYYDSFPTASGPYLAGESEWWFARNLGLVRYIIGQYGMGNLKSYSL
jgi:hypothetical protein